MLEPSGRNQNKKYLSSIFGYFTRVDTTRNVHTFIQAAIILAGHVDYQNPTEYYPAAVRYLRAGTLYLMK